MPPMPPMPSWHTYGPIKKTKTSGLLSRQALSVGSTKIALSSSSLTERGHRGQITEIQQGSLTETTSFGKSSLQMLHFSISSGGFGDICNSFSMSIHFLRGPIRKCMDIEKELHISSKPPEEIVECNICSEILSNDTVSVKLPCCI